MKTLREKISGWLDVPAEALGAARVVLSGRGEARIENACALLEYTSGRICVRAGGERVALEGRALVIRSYTRAEVTVTGEIGRVELCPENAR